MRFGILDVIRLVLSVHEHFKGSYYGSIYQ
jgi:hypothetical protein